MPTSGKHEFHELSLYFHIPFCNRKCPYCHFYVVPNEEKKKSALLNALLLEWKSLLPKIAQHEIISIYFGGGTPTLFGPEPIQKILETIFRESRIAPDCEITIEANPEDVSLPLMQAYKHSGINRISIGVQSLQDDSLIILQRTHNASKAVEAIHTAYSAGLENISIDLMFELPDQTPKSFEQTLHQLQELPISHLSLYNLTIEAHTSFYKNRESLSLPSEEDNLEMLQAALAHLESIGFQRYEISAFAKKGRVSRHNTGYWKGRRFFGLGPSAFSYSEGSRFRNCANLSRYIKAIEQNKSPIDFSETLPYPQNIHELLAVQLRLLDGVDLTQWSFPQITENRMSKLIDEGFIEKQKNIVKLTEKGLLFYDTVASEIID